MCDDPKKKRVPTRSFRFYGNGFCFLMPAEGDAADHPIADFECKGSGVQPLRNKRRRAEP